MNNQEFLEYVNTTPFFNDETKVRFDKEIEVFFKHCENLVNPFGFDPRPVVEELMKDAYLRCLFLHIALEWIHFHTDSLVYMDDRNRIAIRLIGEFSQTEDFPKIYEMYFSEDDRENASFAGVARYFLFLASRMHRTLMQSFTGFLFCFFANYPSFFDNSNREMEEKYGEKWWSLPLI